MFCFPSVLFQVSRWAILAGLLQSGTCPDAFDTSRFPSGIRMSVCWTRARLYRLDGYSGAAARQRSNEELSGGPDGEQLAGVGWKARSAQRWCSSDLLHLLKSKLSQKVFISRQTRLWPDSYTGLDLLILIKTRADLTSAVERGFICCCSLTTVNSSIKHKHVGLCL